MKSAAYFGIVLMCLSFSTGCAFAMGRGHLPDPQVVAQVDLQRYAGTWYEVAHSTNFFQRKCIRSTAQYTVIDDQSVSVLNTCDKANGSQSDISGVARVVDPSVPAKLRVRFNLFARGDYWITELDPDYQWAVVSSPGKGFNFILSRSAPIDPETKAKILKILEDKGFDLSTFIFDQYTL